MFILTCLCAVIDCSCRCASFSPPTKILNQRVPSLTSIMQQIFQSTRNYSSHIEMKHTFIHYSSCIMSSQITEMQGVTNIMGKMTQMRIWTTLKRSCKISMTMMERGMNGMRMVIGYRGYSQAEPCANVIRFLPISTM